MAFLDPKQQERAISQQAFLSYTDNTLTTPDALRKELEEIRLDGVSFDREEHEPHIICIAAPILTNSGRVVGGLSITSSTQRHSLADLEKLKPELLAAAQQIGDAAETWQFPEKRN